MILDRFAQAEHYRSLGPRLWQGLEFLRGTALDELSLGRHDLDGDRLYVLVQEYTTKPASECRFEAHRRYGDIQTVALGQEHIGWAPLVHVQEAVSYDEAHDVAFFDGQGDWLTLSPGLFAVFFPHDAHMPCAQATTPAVVKKIVVKFALA